MSITKFFNPIVFLLVVTLICAAPENPLNENDRKLKKKKKPNIIIILGDDVGTGDLPFYWKWKYNDLFTSSVKMPNLEKLAKEGISFTDAHSTPKCATSRYMLLSGNYPHRGTKMQGAWEFKTNVGQFLDSQVSLPELLQNNGYHTAVFGKWHMGARIPPNGIQSSSVEYLFSTKGHDWSLPIIDGAGSIGFEKSYITMGGVGNPPYSFIRDDMMTTKPEEAKYWSSGPHYNLAHGTSWIGKNQPGEGDPNWETSAHDMIVVSETRAFIEDHLKNRADDPFFAYVSLGAVHNPQSPPKVYLDGTVIEGRYNTTHLDMLHYMDKAVGSITDMVKEFDLDENTIIVFTSDNGGLTISDDSKEVLHRTSGPLRGHKATVWEGGHRVPLIVRYKGTFRPDQKRHHMVGLNDIYATICDLIGFDVPFRSAVDSVSFADYIKNYKKKKQLRRYLPHWTLAADAVENDGWKQAIRSDHIKLVHDFTTDAFQAFNLKYDIKEENDIYPKLMKTKYGRTLIKQMYSYLRKIGPCPFKDNDGKFNIKTKHRENFRQRCNWFKKDEKRCRAHIEGMIECPSICSRKVHRKVCERKGVVFEY